MEDFSIKDRLRHMNKATFIGIVTTVVILIFYLMLHRRVLVISLFLAVPILFIAYVIREFYRGYLQRLEDKAKFESGGFVEKESPDLLQQPDLVNTVQQLLKFTDGVWCGHLADVPLYASIYDRGIVIGPPGTGKTAFLISQLLQWAKTRRPFVCLDIKPEIANITRAHLEALGYTIYCYNPTSMTSHHYNPLADLHGAESIGELSSVLIPSDVAENAVFNESARDFLEALILYVAEEGQPTLPKIRSLVETCAGYRDLFAKLLSSQNEDVTEIANSLAYLADNEPVILHLKN